ncbi:MAG: hypothetical protein OXT67_03965 [Zetaproteobacteria bacterium]|nr:hypothetical protein [Zetaproteobacteria bacterium]
MNGFLIESQFEHYDWKWIVHVGCLNLVLTLEDPHLANGRIGETLFFASVSGFESDLQQERWSELTEFVKLGFPYTLVVGKAGRYLGTLNLGLCELGRSVKGSHVGFVWNKEGEFIASEEHSQQLH